MDSLLSEMGGDTVGLNIVCENREQEFQSKPKRKNSKNKFEKRRAKSRQAKARKQGTFPKVDRNETISDEKGAEDDLVKTNVGVENKQEKAPMTDSTMTQEGEKNKKAALSKQDQPILKEEEKENANEAKDESPITGESWKSTIKGMIQQNVVLMPKECLTKEEKDYADSIPIDPISGNPIIGEPMSRKNQQVTTARHLEDEMKRAEYMSNFHARPHEMDRKSGAVSQFQKSKESTHIFGNLDEDEGDGKGCPFLQCGLHQRVVNAITSSKGRGLSLNRPTVIQQNAWAQMLKGKTMRKNMFIQSETGSGKTLAYFLPILQHLAIDSGTNKQKKVDRNIGGTRALILCPTRELAIQTSVVAEKLCQNTFPWLVAGCLSGGEKRKSEKARLRKGVSILIATPGRLLDHLEKTECLLMALKGKLEWFVLDESDRLLDMGLGSQVEHIVQAVRANQPKSGTKRDGITWQSCLISATITDKVKELASKLLGGDTWVWARAKQTAEDRALIEATQKSITHDTSKSGLELSNATPHQLTQLHMVVSSKLRLTALVAFLMTRIQKKERIVVFMSTCDGVDFHHKLFSEMDSILPTKRGREDMDDDKKTGVFGKICHIHKLHGNIPHKQRHSILKQFTAYNDKEKEPSILIATDVAARGLNLPAVDWIVQYDPPCETADYIHRAGRAARAGRAGHALLFLLPSEVQYTEVLKLRGLTGITPLSLSTTLLHAAKTCPEMTAEGAEQSGQGKKVNTNRSGEAFVSALQIKMEECIADDDRAFKESIKKKLATTGGDKQKKRRDRKEMKDATGPLLESARIAFFSYIRGYSTKEKAVRHIFSARALHLGHVARSFALKEQPKALLKANRSNQNESLEEREGDVIKSTGRKRNSRLAFGAGKHEPKQSLQSETLEVYEEKNQKGFKNKKKSKPAFDENHDNDDSFYSIKGNDQDLNLSSYTNAKAKMLAAANRMQSSGMEFF